MPIFLSLLTVRVNIAPAFMAISDIDSFGTRPSSDEYEILAD
jgi:hypothetical protein